MSVYEKPYSVAELNFSLPLTHSVANKIIVLKTKDKDVEIKLKGCYFKKTDGTGTEVPCEVNVLELVTTPTAGLLFANYLRANKDRNESDVLNVIELKADSTVDETDGTNIFRNGGTATKGVISYSPNVDFEYKLRKNCFYLIKSTVISGTSYAVESVLYGELRLCE